jgi:cellulose synthase/poly-beta-1,6-N-acetylglucosamine synthase-like glycosyltransferase
MWFEDLPQDDDCCRLSSSPIDLPSSPRERAAKGVERNAPGAAPQRAASDEAHFFLSLGVGKPVIAEAVRKAHSHGTTVEQELLAAGALNAEFYYETLAHILGVPYLATIEAGSVVVTDHVDAALARPLWLRVDTGISMLQVVAPAAAQLPDLKALLERRPALKSRMAIASPAVIREAAWSCRAERRVEETVRALFERSREDSARIVLTGAQGFALGAFFSALTCAALLFPKLLLACAHVFLSGFFFACIAFRIAALVSHKRPHRNRPPAMPDPPARDAPLPVYTVVVALHDEAEVVAELIASLGRLRWPRALLDIKLVCEADDRATLSALEAMDLPPEYEIVRVPPVGPRTKPKALAYALAGARGRFLVIYDAEDRPHPDQLTEAYAVFRQSDERLAYLQAPLVISNGARSLISAVFALEYAGLFRGFLPFLARCGLPLPLGGTSNHFRMEALRASGAWDPHNVTEDADLGMRLFRLGYRGAVLMRATQEPAPETPRVWMRQRTRWFKGWLQTWLVMMRSPRRLYREMGSGGFLTFQILIGGMLLSALGHPLLIVFVCRAAWEAVAGEISLGSPLHQALLAIDIWNFVGGYLAFIALAYWSMIAEERRRVGRRWIWVPVYWIAMSVAAWLALVELVRKPFYWAKTPHKPRSARIAERSTDGPTAAASG